MQRKQDLKAAQDKVTETETALKAAQAAQIPAEELVSLRALAAEKAKENELAKADLVAKLKSASSALTEEQLRAKSLDELKVLASFAKVETPNYSGRAVPRAQAEGEPSYAPPDPYAAGITALQGAKAS